MVVLTRRTTKAGKASSKAAKAKANGKKPSEKPKSSGPEERLSEEQKIIGIVNVGKVYSFKYPAHNFHGVLSPLETRRVKVTSIRDLKEQPLDTVTVDIQPLTKRSRFQITGHDLEKDAERSFYCGSIRELTELRDDEAYPQESKRFVVVLADRVIFKTNDMAVAMAVQNDVLGANLLSVVRPHIPTDTELTERIGKQ